MSIPTGLPRTSTAKVFQYPGIWRSYLNTFFYTVAGTAISIVLTIMAAYPFTSKTMPLRGPIMVFFTFTMMFAGGMVPFFLLMKEIGISTFLFHYFQGQSKKENCMINDFRIPETSTIQNQRT